MCEWLATVEWCDVRLACGGRTFTAHRAVLASVSMFLRRILLSCTQEETPTFIVLPDFDLEALSSVLYYIYNGEVVVEKHKLQMFLEVIKTLEIFIDPQYAQKLRESVGDTHLNLVTYRESKWPKNIFALNGGTSDDHEYVNIRKGEQLQDTRSQYSLGDTDLGDKRECRSWTDAKPSLNNPPVLYTDRQRNSFLRDLYIETYPQNGNVNGLTASVLAIPNERYRAPTSVLLTNANGKLPSRADDTLSEISRKTAELTSYTPYVSRDQQPCIQDCSRTYGESCSKRFHDFKIADFTKTKLLVENIGPGLKDPWLNCYPLQINPSPLPGMQQNQNVTTKLGLPTLDLSMDRSVTNAIVHSSRINSRNYLSSVSMVHRNINVNHHFKVNRTDKGLTENNNVKAPIFNQVLDSPWCPRLPYNYKPFRRKLARTPESAMQDKKENEVTTFNDSNNNIELSLLPAECKNVIQRNQEEYKCAVCNQVFTSEEYLSGHMKRHNTTARYSCGECGKTFSQLRNFKYHMSVHRGTREFAATCTVCGKYFNDRGYLSSHMKIHRNRKEYKCMQCPKSFNQRVAYNMHVRIHTGVKPHVCDECGKAFSRKMLLKQHQRTHSGERPYACPHCDKRFADRSNMTLHLRLHTGVKPFSCSLCPKSFTKKHHLKSHLNFHTGAKPYSCPRCKLAFTQSSNMRTHLKKCNVPDDTHTTP